MRDAKATRPQQGCMDINLAFRPHYGSIVDTFGSKTRCEHGQLTLFISKNGCGLFIDAAVAELCEQLLRRRHVGIAGRDERHEGHPAGGLETGE